MENIKELHETFKNRLKGIKAFIHFKTGRNEDLYQEALISLWIGLLKDPEATNSFLRVGIRWRLRDVKETSPSVDKPYIKRKNITITDFDTSSSEDAICFEYLTNRYQPLDDLVIDKVDTEKFLNWLNHTEYKIVLYKLERMSDVDVVRELRMSRKRYYRTKRRIRSKIKEHFSA